MTGKVVIADASAIIALLQIDRLGLLRELTEAASITQTVRGEIRGDLPDWIDVVPDVAPLTFVRPLDPGEASAIALAYRRADSVLLIDELVGRSEARRLGVSIIGTLGVLRAAKRRGLIDDFLPLARALVDHGMWLSERLIRQAVEEVGEVYQLPPDK